MIEIFAPFNTPESQQALKALRAGDSVLLSGKILTGRDAAHKRMFAALEQGQPLPVDLQGACIYYAGPCPAAPGEALGPCGPTTSGRVDALAPRIIQQGLKGMIGKGFRSQEVIDTMIEYGAVYFAATGGAASLISRCVRSAKVLAYEDLGPEAVRLLEVEKLPLIVAIDSLGNNLYEQGPAQYARPL
jgi:fumarate hydratase subunit beta